MNATGVKVCAVCGVIFQLLATLFFVAGTMPIELCFSGFCASDDVDSSDVTFGSDEIDGSAAAMIAFFLSIIALILAIVALVFVFKGNFVKAFKIFGVAMIPNVLVYIYMIPYEIDVGGFDYEVSPGYGLGGGMNTAAFFNFLFGLIFAKKVAANPPVGAPPVAETIA